MTLEIKPSTLLIYSALFLLVGAVALVHVMTVLDFEGVTWLLGLRMFAVLVVCISIMFFISFFLFYVYMRIKS